MRDLQALDFVLRHQKRHAFRGHAGFQTPHNPVRRSSSFASRRGDWPRTRPRAEGGRPSQSPGRELRPKPSRPRAGRALFLLRSYKSQNQRPMIDPVSNFAPPRAPPCPAPGAVKGIKKRNPGTGFAPTALSPPVMGGSFLQKSFQTKKSNNQESKVSNFTPRRASAALRPAQ